MSDSPASDLTWRPITSTDIPAVVTLAAAVDAAESLDFAGGPEFWKWWLDQHDLAADVIGVEDASGALAGIAGTFGSDTEAGARSILWFDAHPDHPGLQEPLLQWAAERGRAQLDAASHPGKVMRLHVEEHRTARRRLVEAHGFTAARTFVEMERSLTDDLPDERPVPAGVEVVPWTADLDEEARLASNAAFADHWGSLPIDPEDWTSMVMDEETVRRDLSFVAKSGGDAVALCLAEVDPEEDPDRVWIQRVGVRPEWQRQGLASMLIVRSLRAAAAAGLTSTALDVDEESAFDATAIYAGLGYRVTKRSVAYLLDGAA